MTTSDPAAATLRLLDAMARLLGEGGCPWDRTQTHRSLVPYLLEEAYELADAIDTGDAAAMREELGDVLLQVVFHARLAEQEGGFAFADVAGTLAEKLVARHPHVFAREKPATAERVSYAWERRKLAGRASRLDGIPAALPALMRAQKIGARAASAGFEWGGTEEILAKVREELGEFKAALAEDRAQPAGAKGERVAHELAPGVATEGAVHASATHDGTREIVGRPRSTPRRAGPKGAAPGMADAELEFGDLLFALVQLARWSGVDAETALRRASRKFAARFRHMEQSLQAAGRDPHALDAQAWRELWEEAKREADELDPNPPASPGLDRQT